MSIYDRDNAIGQKFKYKGHDSVKTKFEIILHILVNTSIYMYQISIQNVYV